MKIVKKFINRSGSISVSITYPHWSSKKPVKQTFVFINDEKGQKSAEKSFNNFIRKGYKNLQ